MLLAVAGQWLQFSVDSIGLTLLPFWKQDLKDPLNIQTALSCAGSKQGRSGGSDVLGGPTGTQQVTLPPRLLLAPPGRLLEVHFSLRALVVF